MADENDRQSRQHGAISLATTRHIVPNLREHENYCSTERKTTETVSSTNTYDNHVEVGEQGILTPERIASDSNHHTVRLHMSRQNSSSSRLTRPCLPRWLPLRWRVAFTILGGIAATYLFVAFAKSDTANSFMDWLAGVPPEISCLVVLLGFFLVSLPFSWGYIVLNIGSGYLFGMRLGLALVVVGASLGACLSTIMCHYMCRKWIENQVDQNGTLKAVKTVMQGHHAYNLVLLTRLTPIPFGLQNALFSLVPLDHGRYVAYTALGLFPTQAMNTYIGTQLNDIQEIINGDKTMDVVTYMIYAVQIVAGIVLTTGVFYKAKIELYKATHDYEAVDSLELLSTDEAEPMEDS